MAYCIGMVAQSRVYESGDFPPSRRVPFQIVVADDDPVMIQLLEEELQRQGHTVHCAVDGQMAVLLARQWHPDLMILDVDMPMTDGIKAFEFLRSCADTAKIPVIFLTGMPSKDLYPLIADATRAAHVNKPLVFESLNSLVDLFLERYSAS